MNEWIYCLREREMACPYLLCVSSEQWVNRRCFIIVDDDDDDGM